ncbi:MAG: 2-amino-4-hydroxy-6-hydroxymethyldihydropteridine diphosphokinase [Ignavibacteria bacterium]
MIAEKAVLGFGSNMGNRFLNIKRALRTLSLNKDLNLLAVSKIYETEPWGYKKQNNFLNCAAVFLCRLEPAELLVLLKSYEIDAGRKDNSKWQAREIDIDVLFYGSKIINEYKLKVPHPCIQQRNFVLKPLVELIPGFIHPILNKSIKSLYEKSTDNCKVKEVISFD